MYVRLINNRLRNKTMSIFEAIENIEDNDYCTEDLWIESFQTLIDAGLVWTLQGWYGRTAMQLIEEGVCQQ